MLEELAADHEIAQQVLEYRQLTKLKGTYVDALPQLIDPATRAPAHQLQPGGRGHRAALLVEPEPAEHPDPHRAGREIRAAFVPREGWQLLVADYSQIELRLLAHMSGDPVLVQRLPQRRGHPHAHRGGGVRRAAADGDAGDAPRRQGGQLRHRVRTDGVRAGAVARHRPQGSRAVHQGTTSSAIRGVRQFIDETIAEVRQTGVSTTLFGRERPIPDMHSRNPNARGFAERTAVNTPLQGTAAT